jgi:hypothetical protein
MHACLDPFDAHCQPLSHTLRALVLPFTAQDPLSLAMAASSSSDRAPRETKRQLDRSYLHQLPDLAGLSRTKAARVFAKLRKSPEIVNALPTSARVHNANLHYYFDRVKCCRTLECEGGDTFPWVLHVVNQQRRNHQRTAVDNDETTSERHHQQTNINNEETIKNKHSTTKNASMVVSFVGCFLVVDRVPMVASFVDVLFVVDGFFVDAFLVDAFLVLACGTQWFEWEYASPTSLLQLTLMECPKLQTLYADALRLHPCREDKPWSIVMGFDEFAPGSQLVVDNRRKAMNLYYNFLELGSHALSIGFRVCVPPQSPIFPLPLDDQ